MTESETRLLGIIRERLGAGRFDNAIVYLALEPLRAGASVDVGDVRLDAPRDSLVAFVDLEPGVNWGHACSYFLVDLESEEVREVAARMPPFLKHDGPAFRLLHRGPLAPKWAVASGVQ